MKTFQFKPLQESDLILLHRWFQEPSINQWYARRKNWSLKEIKDKYEPRILGKEHVPSFIVYKNNYPIGFIQYYSLESNFPEGVQGKHNLLFKRYDPNALVGIDLFIAEDHMRGKGFGVKMIQQFIAEFLNKFAAVVVDPEINNFGALRCYEKAGFKQTLFSENPNYLVMLKPLSNVLEERKVDISILEQVKELLQGHFLTEIYIHSVLFLSEPEHRNTILRITLESATNSVPKSIILKQSLPEQSNADDNDAYARFARDWAGLAFLSSIQQRTHTVPKFYGASKAHRFILIEDLGQDHLSLVDSLTLPNKNKAISSLSRFMKALGCFHATTFGHTDDYEKILKKINETAETPQKTLNLLLTNVLATLASANKQLGLSVTPDLIQEVVDIVTTMLNPSSFTVLTHGDICPDNVYDHEDKDLQLIDFEWAFVRNALLDGTYLRMSMPTCWCAKAIPNDIIVSLEHIYREELKQSIPAATDDLMYSTAYTKACGFWVLRQTLPLLDDILQQDKIWPSGLIPVDSLWKPEENTIRPRFLTRLQAFIDIASQQDMLPHLREMAINMRNAVKLQWPDVRPLPFYPAFAGPFE